MKTIRSSLHAASGVVLAAALLFPCAGAAYEYLDTGSGKVRWNNNSVKLRMHEDSFTAGDAFSTAFEEAVSRWYNNPSPFYFYTQYGDASHSTNNSQTEVFFTSDQTFLGGAPAAALTAWRGDEIVWSDIGFDEDEDYTTSHTASSTLGYGGEYRPFISTSLHELGHALGLQHENDEYNMEGTSYTHLGCNGGSLKFYAGEDACDGAVFLYGYNGTDFEDVSATHWQYDGRDGEYSTHRRTRLLDSSGVELAKVSSSAADPTYKVSSGQTIKAVFTIENNGRHNQTPGVGYYYSSNNTITTSDTLLDTRTPTIGRNDVYTFTNTITLPTGLTSGRTDAVGIIVDRNNAISEVNESNNATYILIYIK